MPLIIFATFSLFAGVLVIFLPETKNLPLPETFRDALLFTENSGKYDFYGLNDGKSSASLVGKESAENASAVLAENDEKLAEKESTTSSLPRRSETFTELAPIGKFKFCQ